MSIFAVKESKKSIDHRVKMIKKVNKIINRKICFKDGFLGGMLYLVNFSSDDLIVSVMSTNTKKTNDCRAIISNKELFKRSRFYGEIRYDGPNSELHFAGDGSSTTYATNRTLLEFKIKLKKDDMNELKKAFRFYTNQE